MLTLIRKVPCWCYDRIRWDFMYRLQQRVLRWRSYDYDSLFAILARLTGDSPDSLKTYYDELRSKRVLEELQVRMADTPDLRQELADIAHLGMEKYVRLDRTVLYCIVRALKPAVFVETGTRWGIGTYFIARAMEENGEGHVYTFDIGVAGSKAEYLWPASQSKIGFLVPERLLRYVSFVEGDSLTTLPQVLSTVPGVNVYYFDSNQTYEHMLAEYRIVFPRMSPGGLFISEDTDKNEAWDDFIKDKSYLHAGEFCSHLGITTERRVSAIRLH